MISSAMLAHMCRHVCVNVGAIPKFWCTVSTCENKISHTSCQKLFLHVCPESTVRDNECAALECTRRVRSVPGELRVYPES